jgi:hypothetical protein
MLVSKCRGDPAVAPAFARIRYVRLQQDARLRQQPGRTLAFAQLVESIALLRVEPDHVFLDGNLFPGHESLHRCLAATEIQKFPS